MANPRQRHADHRQRGRLRDYTGSSGGSDKSDGDIELLQQPTLEDARRTTEDSDSGGSLSRRRFVRMPSVEVTQSVTSSSRSATRHRKRKVEGYRSHAEHGHRQHHQRRRSAPKEEEEEDEPVYVYGSPRSPVKSTSVRISEVRVLGRRSSQSSSDKDDSISVISEKKASASREKRTKEPRTDEKPRSSGNRSRRRLTEDERDARRKARASTSSVHRHNTHHSRKSSIPVIETLKRTLSTQDVRPEPRPSLKRIHTTSSHKISTKSSYEPASVAINGIKRSGFLGSFFAPAIKEEEPVRLVQCLTCLSDDIPRNKSAKLKCGHRMCHSCLRRIFKLSVTDPQHMPPKCCTSDHIPLKHVEKLFKTDFKKRWNQKYQEYNTKNRIYCPARRCGEWIQPANIRSEGGKKYGKCGKCKTKVCALCNGKWHGKKDCPKDEETNKLLETAKEAGWQRCYSCRTMVELKEGCNHMTCRCTAEFCMICGLKWKTCNCPWFNYEAVEEDRLNHMRVPAQVIINFDTPMEPRRRARPPPPPLPPQPWGPQPVRNQQGIVARRRRQEAADEEFARRLQRMNLNIVEEDDFNGNIGDIHGIGNGNGHHMNETYQRPAPNALNVHPANIPPRFGQDVNGAIQPPHPGPNLRRRDRRAEQYNAAPTTQPEERVIPRRTNGNYASEAARHAPAAAAIAMRRARAAEQIVPAAAPRPSVLAGLGRGGGRGSARVGLWRRHVEPGLDEAVVTA